MLQRLQTPGWRELRVQTWGQAKKFQGSSKCHGKERVWSSGLVWGHLCWFGAELKCVSHIWGAALTQGVCPALCELLQRCLMGGFGGQPQ